MLCVKSPLFNFPLMYPLEEISALPVLILHILVSRIETARNYLQYRNTKI